MSTRVSTFGTEGGLVTTLPMLLDRYQMAPPPVRRHLAKNIADAIPGAEKEMIGIEGWMCAKRAWLDANRTHLKYDQRRAAFFAGAVKQHAEIGTAIDRALAIITTAHEAAA